MFFSPSIILTQTRTFFTRLATPRIHNLFRISSSWISFLKISYHRISLVQNIFFSQIKFSRISFFTLHPSHSILPIFHRFLNGGLPINSAIILSLSLEENMMLLRLCLFWNVWKVSDFKDTVIHCRLCKIWSWETEAFTWKETFSVSENHFSGKY